MAFAYGRSAVAPFHGGTFCYLAWIGSQPEGAALVYVLALARHKIYYLVTALLVEFT